METAASVSHATHAISLFHIKPRQVYQLRQAKSIKETRSLSSYPREKSSPDVSLPKNTPENVQALAGLTFSDAVAMVNVAYWLSHRPT